ncbi:hypothetical protein GQ53DRAFT_453109 [Thozetella sp. PMI_491]|nr:hypothetical protein GQ53DRAFT_453109 [Thozetella sp. PMI_491]
MRRGGAARALQRRSRGPAKKRLAGLGCYVLQHTEMHVPLLRSNEVDEIRRNWDEDSIVARPSSSTAYLVPRRVFAACMPVTWEPRTGHQAGARPAADARGGGVVSSFRSQLACTPGGRVHPSPRQQPRCLHGL